MLQKRKRLTDPQAVKDAQLPYCELCGGRAYGEPHHICTRGSGSVDHKLNLVQLCVEHHVKAHNAQISKAELWRIVAEREGMTVDAVEDAVRGMKS
jgi:ribosome-binding protein aMBF1 (putative translation factor)